jgi:large subunit ribosomal protein L2
MIGFNMSRIYMKKLTVGKVNTGGRSSSGQIAVRHRGGGCKKLYRCLDFKRSHYSAEGVVMDIMYDPNRNGYVASVGYSHKVCSLILAGEGLKKNDVLSYGSKGVSCYGMLKNYGKNDVLHSVEFKSGAGGKLCRAAGTYALKLCDYGHKVLLKLPSGELRLFDGWCHGSYGAVSNGHVHSIKKLKAGDIRHLGRRPKVRGVAMNPVDHPHGGGEGRTSGGRPSVTKWCKVAKGKRTRKRLAFEVLKTRDGKIDLLGKKLKRYL